MHDARNPVFYYVIDGEGLLLKSIVLTSPGKFEIIDVPLPSPPGENEVQVRVLRVGICGTDLHAFTGTQPFFSYPRVLGHELALEVIEIGPTTADHQLSVGTKCCLRPYLNCGTCSACLRGLENCCMKMHVMGVHLDGGMREVINVPIDNLHVSSELSEEELALVEMLSIGCHAVSRSHVAPGEVVLVIGLGPIGLGVAQFAHLANATVIGMDVSDSRLAFAQTLPEISHVIDAKFDVKEQLRRLLHNDLPTVVYDATGNKNSMVAAFDYVAHGGRLTFVGLFQGDVTFNDPEFHRRELTVLASRNATSNDFDQVISALESRQMNIIPWITHRASPEQMVEAFADWLSPTSGVVKAMLSF